MSVDYPSAARKIKSPRPIPSIPRPVPLAPRFDVIERHLGELVALRRWVCWRYDWAKGRWAKPPFQVDGRYASPTSPATWNSFGNCRAACEAGRLGFDGVGFVLSRPDRLVAVDLDDCVSPDGIVEPWAVRALGLLGLGEDDYVELSPSGGGLRTFVRGASPFRDKDGKEDGGKRKGLVEVYAFDRYMTVTGHQFNWGVR